MGIPKARKEKYKILTDYEESVIRREFETLAKELYLRDSVEGYLYKMTKTLGSMNKLLKTLNNSETAKIVAEHISRADKITNKLLTETSNAS